jgi:hypothetical protein
VSRISTIIVRAVAIVGDALVIIFIASLAI